MIPAATCTSHTSKRSALFSTSTRSATTLDPALEARFIRLDPLRLAHSDEGLRLRWERIALGART